MEQKGRKKKQTLKRRAKLCQGVGALKRRTCIVQTLLLHKEGMRLFKYGCNGRGMGNFYEKLGGEGGGESQEQGAGVWFYNGGHGNFLKSLYIAGRAMLTPYFMKTPFIACPSLFLKFCPNSLPHPLPLPCHLQPPLPLFFLLFCFIG